MPGLFTYASLCVPLFHHLALLYECATLFWMVCLTASVKRRMTELRIFLSLQRVGMDTDRIDEERAAGWKFTCPEFARLVSCILSLCNTTTL